MLAFAAIAEVALAEIPGVAQPPPSVATVPPRVTSGKIFIIDDVPSLLIGKSPKVNESCTLVINVGGLEAPISMRFTAPSGAVHFGDQNYTYIGRNEVGQRYIPNFPPGGYAVYTFDRGELSEAGLWSVRVISAGFVGSFTFLVTP